MGLVENVFWTGRSIYAALCSFSALLELSTTLPSQTHRRLTKRTKPVLSLTYPARTRPSQPNPSNVLHGKTKLGPPKQRKDFTSPYPNLTSPTNPPQTEPDQIAACSTSPLPTRPE